MAEFTLLLEDFICKLCVVAHTCQHSGRLKQDNYKFESSLGHLVENSLQIKKKLLKAENVLNTKVLGSVSNTGKKKSSLPIPLGNTGNSLKGLHCILKVFNKNIC